jgi:hypothetical protein
MTVDDPTDGPFVDRRRLRRRRDPSRPPAEPVVPPDATYTNNNARWGPIWAPAFFLGFLVLLDFPAFMVWMAVVFWMVVGGLAIRNDPWRLVLTGSRITWRSWLRRGELSANDVTAVEWQPGRRGEGIALRFVDGSSLGLGGSWSEFSEFAAALQRVNSRVEIRRLSRLNLGGIKPGYRGPNG